MTNRKRGWVMVLLIGALSLATILLTTTAQAATTPTVLIETVPVGNVANLPDTRYDSSGHGSVDYAYNIGKYEVTAGQYTEFLNAVAGVDAYGLYYTWMWSNKFGCKIERYDGIGTVGDPYLYQVAANYADRPVNFVNWGDAARFANWLHNSQPTGILTGNPVLDAGLTEDGAYDLNGATTDTALLSVSREADWRWAIPTEDEWYKAAYHKNDGATGNYFDYPTESNTKPTAESPPGTDVANGSANYFPGGHFIDTTYWTMEVGAYDRIDQGEYVSDSPYDTFDQGGNVWEWNETAIDGSSRGLRGGYWGFVSGSLAASYHEFYDRSGEGYVAGFRVASVPEPGSITLLACGAVAGLVWWRRRRSSC